MINENKFPKFTEKETEDELDKRLDKAIEKVMREKAEKEKISYQLLTDGVGRWKVFKWRQEQIDDPTRSRFSKSYNNYFKEIKLCHSLDELEEEIKKHCGPEAYLEWDEHGNGRIENVVEKE